MLLLLCTPGELVQTKYRKDEIQDLKEFRLVQIVQVAQPMLFKWAGQLGQSGQQ